MLQSLSFALIGVSVLRFSVSDPRMLLFLVPFSLYAVALAVSLTSSLRGRRVDRLDHELRVLEYAPDSYPTVDVFLPSAGEPLDILRNTYRHVSRLTWPAQVVVWVLDDSARPDVAALAVEFGFTYRSRPDRGRLKKAGNLRYGYEQSDGDLIVVLDADFVPRPDFLAELVPYFEDADVGIVQSPQFFDAVKGMPWLQRCAGATQELFYRWIQPGRDRSGAAICVGTCAIYRRQALSDSGGFAQIGHSEDVHTGVNLMKAGYRLRYVPVLVSKGLCPDDVVSFLNQQYRWCTGSMSLLADPSFHAADHITGRQRLAFWAGFLYYITTALNVFLSPVPALAMLYVFPQYVTPMNSIYLVGALLLWLVLLPLMFRSRWRIDVLRVQALYSFAHAMAIVHVLSGRTREWVATGAGGTAGGGGTSGPVPAQAGPSRPRTPVGVSTLRVAKMWVAGVQLAIWAGIAHGVLVHGIRDFWAMTAIAALSTWVLAPILLLRAPGSPRGRVSSRSRRETVLAALRPRLPRRTIYLPGTAGHRPSTPLTAEGLRRFRPDIQGLRAVAVLLVVLYHAHVPGLTGGYVGVDVFFVISGFLITGGLLRQVESRGRVDFARFYARRFQRLALPAAVVAVTTLVAARALESIFEVRDITLDALFAASYTMNYALAAAGVDYQQANSAPGPFQHYWSLAVEEQFYLLWPLAIMLCVWLGRQRWKAAVAVMVAVVSVASLAAAVVLTQTDQPMAYFSLQTRAWELGAGAALALAAARLARLPRGLSMVASWVGLLGIVLSAVLFDDLTPFPGVAALLPVLSTVLVIAAGCAPASRGAEVVLARRPFQGIGRVSYAWYLWHWPMLVLFPELIGYQLGWPYQLQVAALSLWAAVLMYVGIERPVARARMREVLWLPVGLAAAGVVAAVAALVALSVPDLVGRGAAVRIVATDTGGVMQGVRDGLETQAAPANLTPAIDVVSADQPASTRNGCHADFLAVQQGDCTYGDPAGTRTMVLVGDSHAQQWLPGLDAFAQAEGWRLVAWTKAACPVADVELRTEKLGNRVYTECTEWREATVDRVTALGADVVVVSQSNSVPGRQVDDQEWADASTRAALDLRAGGSEVVYLMDTPLPASNVPDCVANHLDDVRPCVLDREEAYSAFPGRAEQLSQTMAAAGVTTLDPVDWFCASAYCPAVVGNMLVYRDASHVSTAYSEYLAPALRPLFRTRAD